MTIRAVVFDIGNVLLEWDPERYYDARIGEARRRALFAEVPLTAMNERVDLGASMKAEVAALAEVHPGWHAEILAWHDDWLAMASPLIDHSARLLRALRARGIPVHALTNFGTDTFALARREYPVLTEFDTAIVSGHLGMMKPDPAIYEVLETTTGLSGNALLFADDRPENVAAAKARGWHGHLFESPQGWADRLVAEDLLTPEQAR
ncbi:MAG: HAD-IA family hydrolase [Pseudomonadota bacterium]